MEATDRTVGSGTKVTIRRTTITGLVPQGEAARCLRAAEEVRCPDPRLLTGIAEARIRPEQGAWDRDRHEGPEVPVEAAGRPVHMPRAQTTVRDYSPDSHRELD